MYIWTGNMILPVANARYIVADIKTLPVLSEFCIDSREIIWKYEDCYGDFNGTIFERKAMRERKVMMHLRL